MSIQSSILGGAGGGGEGGSTYKVLHIVDEKAAGTDAGTFTSGAWQTRTLNTKAVDEIGSTLASNQFTLPAGTFRAYARVPAFHVNHHKSRLRNITDGSTTLVGSSQYCEVAAGPTDQTDSIIIGRFTLAGTKTFEIQHQCETTKTGNGFGEGAGFSEVEHYAEIWIEQEVVGITSGEIRQFLYLRDEKAANVDGGTFTSGAWQTRTLNTEVVDEIGSTLAANQFTLPAGTYEIEASAPSWRVDANKLRLRNITDGTTALVGGSYYSGGGDVGTHSELRGRITIASTKTFELQHRCALTSATFGFGVGTDVGEVEVYAEVWIERITTVQPAGDAGSLLYLRDEKASGVAGGDFVSGDWRTRTLNTEVVDEIGSTLASNQFTLPAGTYNVRASAPSYRVHRNQLRLRNVTDGTTAVVGQSAFAVNAAGDGGVAVLEGRFTIAAQKTFELQHRCETTFATQGFGIEVNFDEVEIYAVVWIEKVA